MKIIKPNEAEVFHPSVTCEVHEYEFGDPDINIGTAEIDGRYPESGFLINEKVKEYAYVIRGLGSIATKTAVFEFAEGDVVSIPVGEPYYWDAHCSLVMPCAPAWYPEQSKRVD
jgi:hypothetical protein